MPSYRTRRYRTGLDYFGVRYYASNMGRWMSPDSDENGEPLPYVDFDDPQTLNLYGYVRNNPLSLIDADGHMKCTPKPGDPSTILCEPDPPPAKKDPPKPPPAQANTIPWIWPILSGGEATIATSTRIAGSIGLIIGYLISPPNQYAKDTIDDDSAENKVPKPGLSGKEAAKDVPSWAKGARPKVGESGKDFAERLLDWKYGKENYKKGPGSEFNKIKKWGDRAFQDPKPASSGK